MLHFVGCGAADGTEEAHLAIPVLVRQHVEVLAEGLAPHARIYPGVFLKREKSRVAARQAQPQPWAPLSMLYFALNLQHLQLSHSAKLPAMPRHSCINSQEDTCAPLKRRNRAALQVSQGGRWILSEPFPLDSKGTATILCSLCGFAGPENH